MARVISHVITSTCSWGNSDSRQLFLERLVSVAVAVLSFKQDILSFLLRRIVFSQDLQDDQIL